VVTKASSSGKPSNRVVIGSLPEAITPSRLKELLQGIGPIQVDTVTTFTWWYRIFFDRKPKVVKGRRMLTNITIYFMILTGYSADLFVRLFRKRWQNQLLTNFVTTLESYPKIP